MSGAKSFDDWWVLQNRVLFQTRRRDVARNSKRGFSCGPIERCRLPDHFSGRRLATCK